jgi:hypothetical protein
MVHLQQDLAAAERELDRLKNGVPNVCGHVKKILEEEARIAVLISKLEDSSRMQHTPTVQTMLDLLSESIDSLFCSVEVKRDLVDMVAQNSEPATNEMRAIGTHSQDMRLLTPGPSFYGGEFHRDPTTFDAQLMRYGIFDPV